LHLGIFEQHGQINCPPVLAKADEIKKYKEKSYGAFLDFGRCDSLGIDDLCPSDYRRPLNSFAGKKPGGTCDPIFFFSAHLHPEASQRLRGQSIW
jgi:hypothetical protein